MAVSKRTRYEVLRRDNHACRYCGCAAPDAVLTVDHVIPVALGGSDKPDNLVAACKDCNAGKAASNPDAALIADVAQKSLAWGKAIERWAAIRAAHREERDDYTRRFLTCWRSWHWGPDGETFPLPSDFEQSIWQFHALDFPFVELYDAVNIACGNRRVHVDDTWRYMCGVVWRKVEEMQQAAADIIASEETESADGP
jgi:hypothetical protein